MRTKRIIQLSLLTILLISLIAACGEEEKPKPTAVPTASVPETLKPTAPTTAPPDKPQAPAIQLEDVDWPPQVVYSQPAMGEEVTLDGDITIRFDQPMDQDSVEKALEVKTIPEETAVSGTTTWPKPDTVIFTPNETLARNQVYRIHVGKEATGANGQAMSAPSEFDLKSVGYLQVGQTIPEHNTRSVAINTPITILFNRPVVPLVTTHNQADLPHPLIIDPPVTGNGEWTSTSIYQFTPTEPLAGAANYQVTVKSGLESVDGALLAEDAIFRFATVAPEVVQIQLTPAPEKEDASSILPTAPITITFNMPMERSTTEQAISIRSIQGTTAPLNYTWSDTDQVVTIVPDPMLNLGTTYQVVVDTSAQAAASATALAAEAVEPFRTVPYPAITRTHPQHKQMADYWDEGFSVSFASPMDIYTFIDQIIIDPPPKNPRYFASTDDTNVHVSFQHEPDTTYQITIPGDAADPYGNTLGADYTFSYSTPKDPAVASFNLSGNFSQLSTSFESVVDVIYKNVSQVDVGLYNVGLPANLLVDSFSLRSYFPATEPVRTWNIQPDSDSGTAQISLAEGGTLPTGVYFINTSAPELEEDNEYWQIQQALIIVADTNLVIKKMPNEVWVWATDISSGQPAQGHNLTLYNSRGVPVGTTTSNARGFATFDINNIPGDQPAFTVVSNEPGQAGFGIACSNWSGKFDIWEMGIRPGYYNPEKRFAYIYTDRPIYRPGDTIYYKAIVRDPDFGRYSLPGFDNTTLEINSVYRYDEGSIQESIPVTLDTDGTFYGEYVIPDDAPLNDIQFYIEDLNWLNRRKVTIAEYRKPEFLITLDPEKEEAQREDTVAVVLDAQYFSGGAVSNAHVIWSTYTDNYYPYFPDQQYDFGDRGHFNYTPECTISANCRRPLIDGESTTDANGQFVITLPANLLDGVEEGSQKVSVQASVTDLANFPILNHTAVIFHEAEMYVGIRPENYLTPAGQEATVELVTVDWAGEPVPNQTVNVTFYRRDWESERTIGTDAYRTIWTPKDTQVAQMTTTTDAQGKATASFTPGEGGSYLAVANAVDAGGHSMMSNTALYALSDNYAGWRSAPREITMELVPDQKNYKVGDTARILVQSPFDMLTEAWLTIERGNLLDQKLISVSGGEVIEIPITPDMAPNVYVSIATVKPVEPDNPERPFADIRFGVTELQVDPEQFALTLTITPQQENYAPGETAVFDIQVTDYTGAPVSAEVSLALVDLAVLTLKEDNAPHIFDSFYSPQDFYSSTGSGLFISGEGLNIEEPIKYLGGLGGGGGDGGPYALTKTPEEDETRKNFPDTAYWEAKIVTDSNGQATVEVPLPDTTTTWRMHGKAVTTNSLVGQTDADIITSLPLIVRPVTPRFFTVGDQIELGAVLNNNTEQDMEAVVNLTATGFEEEEIPDQTVTVPANGNALVHWPVTVADVSFADLTFSAEAGEFRDATKPSFGIGPEQLIPVYRYDAPDYTSTAGILEDAGIRVEAALLPDNIDTQRGSVDVQLSASLAAALINALEAHNLDSDNQCAGYIADQLLPDVATARIITKLALDKPDLLNLLDSTIPANITKLESSQQEDGGWSWCGKSSSNPWLSAYILLTLIKAEEAGHSISDLTLRQAASYLQRQLHNSADLSNAAAANQQAFFLYILAELGHDVVADTDALFAAQRGLLDPYAKAFLLLAYNTNNHKSSNQATLLADLNEAVILSATSAHWEDAAQDFANLSSDIRGTAIIIDALARTEPDAALAPQAVNWLMAARRVAHWPSRHETAWSIFALTDWLVATQELEAAYDWQLSVNTEPIHLGSFSQANIIDNVWESIPMNELIVGDVNFFEYERGSGNGRLYYSMNLNAYLPAESVAATDHGFTVQRAYYDAACQPETETCLPLNSIKAGEQVRVMLTVIVPHNAIFTVVTDPIPAGAEAIDPDLKTTPTALAGSSERIDTPNPYYHWGWWRFDRIEYRDEAVRFYADDLPAGTYQYTYYLQANIPGEFQVMPAQAQESYFPEVFGRSDGMKFTIME